ncbi:MAG: PEP-CTERM sorting domain-containing protein [Gemmatimonadales bacterium]|nr:PEP-CTERM sorting domain-containing protein [Gemmatimonadales bacterium]
MRLRLVVGALVAATVAVHTPAFAQSQCDAVAGNLVANCGFETGSFSSWSVGNATIYDGVTDAAGWVNSGRYGAYFGHVGGTTALAQIVNLVGAGKLSFRIRNREDGASFFRVDFNPGPNVTPTVLYMETQNLAYDWKTVNLNVTGSGSDVLAFTFRHDPSHYSFDDVVLTAVPEPGTYALMATGLVGLVAVRRRKK